MFFCDRDFSHAEWRDIPDYEGLYQASSEGHIRRHPDSPQRKNSHTRSADGVLAETAHHSGYLHTCLTKDGKAKCFRVHRVIAAAWWGWAPPSTTVNHKNFIKTDNRIENIEYLSIADNVQHAHRAGKYKNPTNRVRGEKSGRAKLTEMHVRAIRILAREFTNVELARCFGVHPVSIGLIVKRTNWAHVS